MPSLKLTHTAIKKLPNPDKRTDYSDMNMRGLYLRVYPTGRKVWRLRYRYRNKPKVLMLGTWPAMGLGDARRAVIDAHDLLDEGSDPTATAQKEKVAQDRMPTVTEFVDEYIERHAKPNKRSWKTDKRILHKDFVPHLGAVPLDEVHRRDIVGVLDRIVDRGSPVMAKNAYAAIRKMFNFAVERGILEQTPTTHIRPPSSDSRDVVLSDKGIRHLWRVTRPFGQSDTALPLHQPTRLALRLLLLTGQRSGEVRGFELSELDRKRRLWVIPGRRTKNGLTHSVPLSDWALEIIDDALEMCADSRFLFAAKTKEGHLSDTAAPQAMKRAFADWTPRYWPHDLRRTVATRLSELGFNRLIVDKVTNHKDRTVGGVYDRHTYDKEKRQALDAWARTLAGVLKKELSGKS